MVALLGITLLLLDQHGLENNWATTTVFHLLRRIFRTAPVVGSRDLSLSRTHTALVYDCINATITPGVLTDGHTHTHRHWGRV